MIVETGDAVHPGDPVTVDRYTAGARVNHWITATCLVLLALSGLALFHPSLFFLTDLFGGGQATRAIHPWIGVVLFFSFFGLFFRFWRANLWEHDRQRLAGAAPRRADGRTRTGCRKSANTMPARRSCSGRCRS